MFILRRVRYIQCMVFSERNDTSATGWENRVSDNVLQPGLRNSRMANGNANLMCEDFRPLPAQAKDIAIQT